MGHVVRIYTNGSFKCAVGHPRCRRCLTCGSRPSRMLWPRRTRSLRARSTSFSAGAPPCGDAHAALQTAKGTPPRSRWQGRQEAAPAGPGGAPESPDSSWRSGGSGRSVPSSRLRLARDCFSSSASRIRATPTRAWTRETTRRRQRRRWATRRSCAMIGERGLSDTDQRARRREGALRRPGVHQPPDFNEQAASSRTTSCSAPARGGRVLRGRLSTRRRTTTRTSTCHACSGPSAVPPVPNAYLPRSTVLPAGPMEALRMGGRSVAWCRVRARARRVRSASSFVRRARSSSAPTSRTDAQLAGARRRRRAAALQVGHPDPDPNPDPDPDPDPDPSLTVALTVAHTNVRPSQAERCRGRGHRT